MLCLFGIFIWMDDVFFSFDSALSLSQVIFFFSPQSNIVSAPASEPRLPCGCVCAQCITVTNVYDRVARPWARHSRLEHEAVAPAELIQADSEQQSLLWAAAATAAARPAWTRWWNQIPIKLWQDGAGAPCPTHPGQHTKDKWHTQGTQKWMVKHFFFFLRLRQRSTL